MSTTASTRAATDQVLAHLIPQLSQLWLPIELIAGVIGLYFVIKGIVIFAHPSKERLVRGSPMMSSLLAIFSGSMLLALASFNNTLTQSFFSQNAPTKVLQYAPAATAAGVGIELRFAVAAIHILGLIAVINGLVALTKVGEGRGFEALVFLSMGGIALRIGLFISLMGVSMGPAVSSVVQKFF